MPTHRTLGKRQGVSLHVAAWDGVAAEVDLSCACMFSREARSDAPVGGLAHLDAALDYRLVRWRADGRFTAGAGEMLLVDRPPATIAASAVLVIGLGSPDDWSPAAIAGAAGTAFAAATLRRATSVAFAPSMLDGGLLPEQTAGAGGAMVRAVVRAIDLDASLSRAGLAEVSSVRDWYFDVGPERLDQVHDQFRDALDGIG